MYISSYLFVAILRLYHSSILLWWWLLDTLGVRTVMLFLSVRCSLPTHHIAHVLPRYPFVRRAFCLPCAGTLPLLLHLPFTFITPLYHIVVHCLCLPRTHTGPTHPVTHFYCLPFTIHTYVTFCWLLYVFPRITHTHIYITLPITFFCRSGVSTSIYTFSIIYIILPY